jgi:hypothetical protein
LDVQYSIPGTTGKSGFLLQSAGILLHTRDRQLSLPSPFVQHNAVEGLHKSLKH